MLSKEDNDIMCRVEGSAPMGGLMRQHYWIPAVRAGRVEADGAPVRVRLLGDDFVAWRATDGRVGFIDEACPHRGVSMALAQNRNCKLTCIFHGWTFGVDGKVLEAPTEGTNSDAFCKTVPFKHYPTQEAAGIVWVYLGDGSPPPFWNLPFLQLPESQYLIHTQKLDCNWLQGVEGTIDSSHVSVLHQSWLGTGYAVGLAPAGKSVAVEYAFESRPYGYTASATRQLGDGTKYVRITEHIFPWFSIIPPENPPQGDRTCIFAAPTDDTHSVMFFVRFNPYRPVNASEIRGQVADPDFFAPIGGPDEHWGQDRELMKQGHWTGFRQLVAEDFAMSVSQGGIADRSKEYLSQSDQFVVRVRRGLIKAARDFQKGQLTAPVPANGIDYSSIMARAATVPVDCSWQDVKADPWTVPA